MRKMILVPALLFGMVAGVGAQSKVSARLSCGKANVNETAGTAEQSVMFTRTNCSWSPSYSIAGSKARRTLDASIAEAVGSTARFHGFSTDIMETGDTTIVRYDGTMQMRKDGSGADKGTWRFIHGTGKFKGVTGSGTFKGAAAADGTSYVDVTGHYSLGKTKGK